MEKSQLILVLRTFSRKEIRDCRKWLQSPAHNQRDDVLELYDYLMSSDHLDNEKFLEKERVFRKIFPGETYDDARLRQTMHFLLKAVEAFLIDQELQTDPARLQIILSGIYRQRNLDTIFQRSARISEQLLENHPLRDIRHLQNAYLLEQEKYNFGINKKRTADLNLQELSDALDTAYLADKLRHSCLVLANQSVFKKGFQIGLLPPVLQYVEENRLQEVPAIGAYYFICKSYLDRANPVFFEKLKAHIERFGHCFSKPETMDIYLLALNYCIAKINQGEKQYLREMFELNRKGIEHEVFIENGTLDRYTFRNIVTAGITLREFDWVSSFIENYQQYLDPRHRENFVHFAWSSLYFEKGDYEKARQLLVHFEYSDVLINLQAKSMLIRMYYEEGENDALESLLESVRNYLHRKDVIGYHKTIYNNLIRYTRKLVRLNPYNKAQKEKFRQEIAEAKQLRERTWFLEQLEAM